MKKIYIQKQTPKNVEDPHGYVYLLYKVHKERSPSKPVPIRRVYSNCVNITNPIGKGVDIKHHLIAKTMQTYLKDSIDFKKMTDNLVRFDPREKLFTYDPTSMHTNIPTDYALEAIGKYLTVNQSNFDHYHAPTLIRALEILMNITY